MSFSIYAAGTPDQVRQQVEAAECYGDAAQFDAVRALILSEVGSWPESLREDKVLGLLVEASGHHDSTSRNLTLSLRPLWLPAT